MTGNDANATGAVIAALAREVDGLRRQLRGLAEQVQQLDGTLAQALGDLDSRRRGAAAGVRPVSWLHDLTRAEPGSEPGGGSGSTGDGVAESAADDQPADPGELAAERLAQLCEWVGVVYMRYTPAGRDLSSCWLWHPDVVEELAWLHQAWLAAYDPKTGAVLAVADWHDRYRPGVAARIKTATRGCSLHSHQDPERPTGAAPDAPGHGLAGHIAWWWTSNPHAQPPAPGQPELDAELARLNAGRHR